MGHLIARRTFLRLTAGFTLATALSLTERRTGWAQANACSEQAVEETVRPAAPSARGHALAGGLADPLAPPEPGGALERAIALVDWQLAEVDAAACYHERLPHVAARTVFLSPVEYLIVGHHSRDPERRRELLALYAADPEAAVRALTPFWPSSSAEMLLSTRAFFDLDLQQVVVNRGATRADELVPVLVHELWHALANMRHVREADGQLYRISGFYRQVRQGSYGWRPVDEYVDQQVPTFLLNEALAMEMEREATGHEPPQRPDIRSALGELHELFDVLGREQVIYAYLESAPERLHPA